MMKAQTLQPDHIEIVNYPAESNNIDITQRYRIGYNFFRNKGYDLIAFIENDDYYHPEYLETMVTEWKRVGKPDLIGTNYTPYYHLGLRYWFDFKHDQRASAMNTLIKPDLDFPWCNDSNPYTDLYLWLQVQNLTKHTFKPSFMVSIGLKHNTGLCGGIGHNDRLEMFTNRDIYYQWLRDNMDPESFSFYSKIFDFVDRNRLVSSLPVETQKKFQ